MAPHVVPVALGDASYDILLDRGLLDRLGSLLDRYCPAPRYAVITDSTVARTYGERVISQLDPAGTLFTFPAGEWNKTRDVWADLTDRLLAAGFDRDAAVVALGGGVVGDLAGFLAATYLRGIRYVQVPTSLLAMIDSSIGGKTGVDTAHGKNLVGAFHQPAAVIADVDTLATLAPVQLIAGMAEAVKHGAIMDADYFEQLLANHTAILDGDPTALLDVVAGSVGIKSAIVVEDEREHGRRAILNFGHTIAHAIEAATGYEHLHGEAVAIGMLAEAELGTRLGITTGDVTERLRQAIEIFRLPTEPSGPLDAELLLQTMGRDKKNRDGSVMFALLKRLGEAARHESGSWTVSAPEKLVREVLSAVHITV